MMAAAVVLTLLSALATSHCAAAQQKQQKQQCEPVAFAGDSWSPALQPASCGPDCAPVRPFFWLKAGEPGGAVGMAAQALNFTRRAPAGRVTLGSYNVHFGLNTHPADAILAANESRCAGAPGQGYHGKQVTFSGLWWDHGVHDVSARFQNILGNYSAIGGVLDRFVLDTEIWLTAKELFDKVPAACALARSEAIERDPRWPPLLAALRAQGLNFGDIKAPGYVYRAVRSDPNKEMSAPARFWADMMHARTAEYLNAAIWAPVAAAFPRSNMDPSQQVSFSNYAFTLRNHSRTLCVPDWFGGCSRGDSPPGTHALNGNTQSHSLYYMRFWNPQFEQGLRTIYPSMLSYPKTPFNAVRWSVLLLREQIVAGVAPNALSQVEDVRVRPWVAYRGYSHGAAVNNSDYYQEALLHYLATGADDINFWNPHELADLGVEDNRIFGRTLLEATAMLGCAGRRWSFPSHAMSGSSPTVGPASPLPFAWPLLLTGMSSVGPDGARTRFRLTTANGAARGFRTGTAPLEYIVPPSKEDGGGAAMMCKLTFSAAAREIVPPAALHGVAPLGVWVEQPDGASAPVVLCS